MSTDDFTATQSQEQRLDAQVLSAGEAIPLLAGYQLEELKGRGSFGEVWSARQLSSGQKVAVHGWVYSLFDGRVRQLGMDVESPEQLMPAYHRAVAAVSPTDTRNE